MLKQILSAAMAVTALAVQGEEKELNQEETMVIDVANIFPGREKEGGTAKSPDAGF